MKKGKWNYMEDIEYNVILVKLAGVAEPKMHWQNAFAGQERQVVVVKDKKGHQFWIDNADGSGLLKIERGGGPDSYSAHVAGFEFIRVLPESEWQQWNPELHTKYRDMSDLWQKEHHPEEYKKLESLRETNKLIRSGNYHIDENGTIRPCKK